MNACQQSIYEWERSWRMLAYSDREAREWWAGLSDAEHHEILGLEQEIESEQTSLF